MRDNGRDTVPPDVRLAGHLRDESSALDIAKIRGHWSVPQHSRQSRRGLAKGKLPANMELRPALTAARCWRRKAPKRKWHLLHAPMGCAHTQNSMEAYRSTIDEETLMW